MKIRRACVNRGMMIMGPPRIMVPRRQIGRGYYRRMRGGNFLSNARRVIGTTAVRAVRALGKANTWLKKNRAISRAGDAIGSIVPSWPGLAIRAAAGLAGQVGYGRRRHRQRGSGGRMVVVRRRR
jgi:hypothetical protein